MSGIWKWILDSGLVQARVKQAIAWAGTAAAAAIVTMIVNALQSHGFVISPDLMAQIQSIGGGIAALIVMVLTLIWHLKDAKHVDTALLASAQAGELVGTVHSKALERGDAVTLPSGHVVILGQPSPGIPEKDETAALNSSQATR